MTRGLRVGAAAWLAALVMAIAGCGDTEPSQSGGPELPDNVSLVDPGAITRTPQELEGLAHRLAGLVDFHDDLYSGSWCDPETGHLYLGVAKPAGRALLRQKGLADRTGLEVVPADRSLVEGQQYATDYVEGSAFQDQIVGYGALPQGDGISIWVTGDELDPGLLAELGELPVRVVVRSGSGFGTTD